MLKLSIKIMLLLGKFIAAFLMAILFIYTIKYITCPVYNFKKGKPFSGNKIYNPYKSMNSDHWRKANFQIQSHAWSGITSGRGNTNEEIYKVYKNLQYDIIATSDYQKINQFRMEDHSYIPVYEHGYGIFKNHHVLIGASKVLWADYPFFQTIHNKQHILNLLRDDSELVYIAHPKLRNAFKPEDMMLLSGYDGLEVLNNYRTSLIHWDAALSSGRFISILSNDDAHDISNPDEIGHHCTFINSPTTNKDDIIKALKKGNAYGAKIYRPEGEKFREKIKRTKTLPAIKQISVVADSLIIMPDTIAKEIRFIGQDGILLQTQQLTDSSIYLIKESDTYIRTEIEFFNKSIYYLNPVFRYDALPLPESQSFEVNILKTSILRVIGFTTLLFIAINIVFIRKKMKNRRKLKR